MKKWFHVIGISGKATAYIAKEFKDKNWFVTGTDHQFLPPASTVVEASGIPYEIEYHYSHLTKAFWEERLKQTLDITEHPNLVLVIESVTDKNKEYLFAKNKGLDVRPFSKILEEYFAKENSIVVAGTAGKSTTTALIVYCLQQMGIDPNFMVGSEVSQLDKTTKITESDWSVFEGDEYYNRSLPNAVPKFLNYKPKYVVITNVGYEHVDVFPTEESYNQAFIDLIKKIPEDGLLFVSQGDKTSLLVEHSRCPVFRYGFTSETNDDLDYHVSLNDDHYSSQNKTEYEIFHHDTAIAKGTLPVIGDYNALNFVACFGMLSELFKAGKLQIDEKKLGFETGQLTLERFQVLLNQIMNTFKGVKKRLEVVYKDDHTVVIDDFGIAPDRARNSIETVRKAYSNYKIFAIFEPNSGSRFKDQSEFLQRYAHVFDAVDEVIIPDLSTYNPDFATTEDFLQRLQTLGVDVHHVKTDRIFEYVTSKSHDKQVFLCMSAYRLDQVVKNIVQFMENRRMIQ